MGLQAVLLDKDGVLLDMQVTWGRWAVRLLEGLSEGRDETLRDLARVVGVDLEREAFEPGSIAIAGTVRDMAEVCIGFLGDRWTLETLERHLSDAACDVGVMPTLPLRPVLEPLARRGLKLAVVTNDAEEAARVHLEALGVSELFGAVVGYDSGFGAKPGPGSVLGACELLGVAPEDAVMVGDSLHDLHAARAAGTSAVGVLTGVATAAELEPFADAVLPDVAHLPGWLA